MMIVLAIKVVLQQNSELANLSLSASLEIHILRFVFFMLVHRRICSHFIICNI